MLAVESLYDSLHQLQTRLILFEGKNAFFDVVIRGGLHPPPLGRETQAVNFFFDFMDLFVHVVRKTEFVSFQVREERLGIVTIATEVSKD